jgi:acyl carrier protein
MTTTDPMAEQIRRQIHDRLPYLAGLLQPQTRLSEMELDSLDTLELLMLVDELYGVRFSPEDIGQVSTVGDLAALIAARCMRPTTARS